MQQRDKIQLAPGEECATLPLRDWRIQIWSMQNSGSSESAHEGRRALICGVSGQDGAYLARHLLSQGYVVFGTSRDAQMSSFRNLRRLGIDGRVQVESMALTDFRSVFQVVRKTQADEIYNLAGQSSVGLSFQQPVETLESIALGTLNVLEAIRLMERPDPLYNAGSSECFGDTNGVAATETTRSDRAVHHVAKAAAFWEVANYREAYGLFACWEFLQPRVPAPPRTLRHAQGHRRRLPDR